MSDDLILAFLERPGTRLECDGRWLVCNDGEIAVYKHKPYARHVTVLYRGDSLAVALRVLGGEWDADGNADTNLAAQDS